MPSQQIIIIISVIIVLIAIIIISRKNSKVINDDLANFKPSDPNNPSNTLKDKMLNMALENILLPNMKNIDDEKLKEAVKTLKTLNKETEAIMIVKTARNLSLKDAKDYVKSV